MNQTWVVREAVERGRLLVEIQLGQNMKLSPSLVKVDQFHLISTCSLEELWVCWCQRREREGVTVECMWSGKAVCVIVRSVRNVPR